VILIRRVKEAGGGASHLLPHFPQALHTAEQVAAPQQLAAKPTIVPSPGTAMNGIDSNAPIAATSPEVVFSESRQSQQKTKGEIIRVVEVVAVVIQSFRSVR
jgi:hypothetical protein